MHRPDISRRITLCPGTNNANLWPQSKILWLLESPFQSNCASILRWDCRQGQNHRDFLSRGMWSVSEEILYWWVCWQRQQGEWALHFLQRHENAKRSFNALKKALNILRGTKFWLSWAFFNLVFCHGNAMHIHTSIARNSSGEFLEIEHCLCSFSIWNNFDWSLSWIHQRCPAAKVV